MSEREQVYIPEAEVPTQEVVVVLKPGAPEYENRLREFIDEHGLTVESRQEQAFTRETLQQFYPHREEYLDQMEEAFGDQPTVALLVKGPNALELMGRLKRHVRGILHLRPPLDGLHSSDTSEEAGREKDVLHLDMPNHD